jgi:hypothetical protein
MIDFELGPALRWPGLAAIDPPTNGFYLPLQVSGNKGTGEGSSVAAEQVTLPRPWLLV